MNVISDEELLKKLKNDFDTYRTTVNIVGGISIGIVVCLIFVFIYLYGLLRAIPRRFDETLDKLDPLRKFTVYNKYTMMQQQKSSVSRSTNSLPNRLNPVIESPENKSPLPINRLNSNVGSPTPSDRISSISSPALSERKPPSSPRFDFSQGNQQQNNQANPGGSNSEMVLKVPNAIPRRLQSQIDSPNSPMSPMHFDGKSPSSLTHFDFPSNGEKYQKQISQDFRKGPMSPY